MSDEPRRLDDKLVIELKQKFQDFLDRYERDQQSIKDWQAAHKTDSDEWRKSLDLRFKPWEDFIGSVNMGWKILIGLATAVSLIYAGVSKIAAHVKWNG